MTKLVIFDVDGTLVDSQAHIVNALETAFTSLALSVPSREQMRSIIGLSLDNAFRRLADTSDDDTIDALVDAYKASFVRGREVAGDGHSMLFDGARDAVLALAQRDDVMLAIATGKSRQGLDVLMRGWDFSHHFISAQVADDHPSKPNPSMVSTCLDDAGLGPKDAVVIGDTTFERTRDALPLALVGAITPMRR